MALAEPALLETVLHDLAGPPLPLEAERAWHIFTELNGTRSNGMQGVGAITYTELHAYQVVTDTRLTPLDVALIREADGAFLQHAMQRMKTAEAPSALPTPED